MAEQATSHGTPGGVLRHRTEDALRQAGWATTGLVVLLGEPRATEAVWDDVLDPVPGQWRHLWRPADAAALLGGLRAIPPPAPWTVVRIADLRRFLMPDDPELAVELASTLRGALRPSDRPLVVAATMPADRAAWRLLTQAPASGGHDRWSQARALLLGATVLLVDTTAELPAVPEPGVMPASVRRPVHPAAQPDVVPGSTGARVPLGWTGWAGPPPAPERVVLRPAPTAGPAVPGPAGAEDALAEDAGAEDAGAEDALDEDALDEDALDEDALDEDALEEDALEEDDVPEEEVEEGIVEVGRTRGRRARRPRSLHARQPVLDRWRPAPAPDELSTEESAQDLRDRGLALEVQGDTGGAERLYELAAQAGDLDALGRLGALRSAAGSRPSSDEARRMYEAAAAEGNTAVLFGLAAAGHVPALRLLARLRAEAEAR